METAVRSVCFQQSLHICLSIGFVGVLEERKRMSEWVGGRGENKEVRGRVMPGSYTVTMTTDITSQEQHSGCLCGLKWQSWRLALASCGCYPQQPPCFLLFFVFPPQYGKKVPRCSCQIPVGGCWLLRLVQYLIQYVEKWVPPVWLNSNNSTEWR